jgi:hypothetical protein
MDDLLINKATACAVEMNAKQGFISHHNVDCGGVIGANCQAADYSGSQPESGDRRDTTINSMTHGATDK